MRTFIGLLLGGLIALGASGISNSAALAQGSPKSAPATGTEAEASSKPAAPGKNDGKSGLGVEKDSGAVPQGCPYQNRKLDLIV